VNPTCVEVIKDRFFSSVSSVVVEFGAQGHFIVAGLRKDRSNWRRRVRIIVSIARNRPQMFRLRQNAVVRGFAAAILLLGLGATTAHAAKGATCISNGAGEVKGSGTDGSDCTADGVASGDSGVAKAKGDSTANSEAESGGTANANANTKSEADATASAACKANANSNGDGSFSEAVCTADHGSAKSVTGKDGNSTVEAFDDCKSSGNAKNGGEADAFCETSGGFATATTSNGGFAKAFDDAPPTCDTSKGGTAKVRSTFGNCGP
jgi:hypothetical protein